MRKLSIALASLAALAAGPLPAEPAPKCSGPQIGTWRLTSFSAEDLQTHEKSYLYGMHPTGFLGYGTDCRMYVEIVGDNRTPPASDLTTDAESAALFHSLTFYGGTYSIDGDTVTHHLDISWNQLWTGTTKVRQIRIDGDSLYLLAHVQTSSDPKRPRESLFDLAWTRLK